MITTFDTGLQSLFLAIRSPELTTFFVYVTELGNTPMIVFPGLALVAWLILRNKQKYALILLVALVGSRLTTWGLKVLIARPRPEDSIALFTETSFAFPSGHTTGAAALYGFLIYFVWRTVKNKNLRYSLSAFFALIIFGVALSRVYLGVHYPSDVIFGLVIGILSVAIGARLTKTRW